MPRLFLLDGTALAYRAHFALQRSGLSTPEGKPSGATYGFTMTLRKLLEGEAPDAIVVAFDPPGDTFRHARYAEYKATREKMADELVVQIDWLHEVVRAHGIPIVELPGFEADDVIGTLSTRAAAAGWEVLIVSGDKDMMQLVGPQVRLYNVFKPGVDLVIEAEEAVREKFGTTPEHVIDVLAIMGDSSDNVPGVGGIGEKGAIKLIQEHGSVAAILENLERIPGKAGEHLRRDVENLKLSLELVTIDRDVPFDLDLAQLGPARPDPKALAHVFAKLGFQSLLKKVAEGTRAVEAREYRIVRGAQDLAALLEELRGAGAYAIDTETTGLEALEVRLVGISFSTRAQHAWYVPFNLEPPVLSGGRAALLEALRPVLTDPQLKRVGQNTKYDWLVLHAAGVDLPPPEFDTMLASYCSAGATRRHGIDDLALRYFDLKKIPTSELIGTGKNQVTMEQVPVEKVGEYACEDADVAWRLYEVLSRELVETGAEALFRQLELPLVPVLTAMEIRGIRVDRTVLDELRSGLEQDLAAATAEIHALAGTEFNVNSTKALGEVLFERLKIHEAAGLKRVKKTQTGYATDAETLETHYADVPIVQRLLAYREAQKLLSTYVDALPEYVSARSGRIHCSFSQVAAATGRLASSEPNLQNIPIRTERGRQLRKAFVPREADAQGEWVLLSADYSQIELRVMAHFAGDEALRQAFVAGKDIHAETAAIVFGVLPGLVSREMRSRAKAINFGLLYGMGPARLARETGLSVPEARQFIERYFASFPRVRGWIDATLASAREKGYVETLLGRKRRFPDINSEDSRVRSFAENAAVNTPIQGSAADLIKKAMIDLDRELRASGLAAGLLLQVHDELLLELPERELEPTRELVRRCMEHAVELSVPLKVDFGHGRNWLEAH